MVHAQQTLVYTSIKELSASFPGCLRFCSTADFFEATVMNHHQSLWPKNLLEQKRCTEPSLKTTLHELQDAVLEGAQTGLKLIKALINRR